MNECRKQVSGPYDSRPQDDRLRDDVVRELGLEPEVEPARLSVAAEDGLVTVTGLVRSRAGRFAAERAARRVPEAKVIVNAVRVDPETPRGDEALGRDVLRALARGAGGHDGEVRATVRDGWVTLEGAPSARRAVNRAELEVRRLHDLRGVTSVIAPRAEDRRRPRPAPAAPGPARADPAP